MFSKTGSVYIGLAKPIRGGTGMAKKLPRYLILLAVILVFNFALPRALPGSPVKTLGVDEGSSLTETERWQLLEAYNLDKPLTEQFALYLKAIFTGDLGMSYSRKAPVTAVLGAALPWTLLLAVCSMILSLLLGSALGALSVRLRRKKRDMPLILGVSLIGSFPTFWLGMVFIAVFGVSLKIFPLYGAYDMWAGYTGLRRILDVLAHMAMPLMTMTLASLMLIFTTVRTSLLSVLNEDYIRLAEMRGLSKRRINFCYQWRNAFMPVFTVVMLDLGYIFSGSVVIESVFSYPGVGKVLYDAVLKRDYPLMQYSFLLISLTVIIASVITELVYPMLDPRLRKS